jgi:serine/threonine-protein kinase
MVYRMLTGTLPQNPISPASHLNANLDPEWDVFLQRVLARQPHERFTNARAMAAQLDTLARHWNNRMEATCQWYAPTAATPSPQRPAPFRTPRSKPIRTGVRNAQDIFRLSDLWQPRHYCDHLLEADDGNATVSDATAGLQWLQSGSDFPLNWFEAWAFIEDLNVREWGGYRDWRLPTVEELLTILRPPPSGTDYCLPDTFDSLQKRLWSSDRRTYTSAWYVSLELGFVAWHDKTFANHVKAVRHL